jgi:hypothetical protein
VIVREQWVAAIEEHVEGTDWGSTWLRVFQVHSHHLSRCEIAGWAQMADTKVRRLIIGPTGTVAWASSTPYRDPLLAFCGFQSKVTVLDADPGLQFRTISLDEDSVLHWTDSEGEHQTTIK